MRSRSLNRTGGNLSTSVKHMRGGTTQPNMPTGSGDGLFDPFPSNQPKRPKPYKYY